MSREAQNPSQTTANNMAASARDKMNGVWSSLRSMSSSSSSDEKKKMKKKSESRPGDVTFETMWRTMFGSCVAADLMNEPAASMSDNKNVLKVHARAEQAITSLREQSRASSASSSSPRTPERALPKPFPVSSPRKAITSLPMEEICPAAAKVGPLLLEASTSRQHDFDDGISAISAHTLEELARQENLKNHIEKQLLNPVRSDLTTDSSLFPASNRSRSRSGEQQLDAFGSFATPDNIFNPFAQRSRTHSSKDSRRSRNSRSTKSTKSTDFEQAWRRDEQQYWKDLVREDSDDMSSPRRRALMEKAELLTTARMARHGSVRVVATIP
jgi:hypothetical protein